MPISTMRTIIMFLVVTAATANLCKNCKSIATDLAKSADKDSFIKEAEKYCNKAGYTRAEDDIKHAAVCGGGVVSPAPRSKEYFGWHNCCGLFDPQMGDKLAKGLWETLKEEAPGTKEERETKFCDFIGAACTRDTDGNAMCPINMPEELREYQSNQLRFKSARKETDGKTSLLEIASKRRSRKSRLGSRHRRAGTAVAQGMSAWLEATGCTSSKPKSIREMQDEAEVAERALSTNGPQDMGVKKPSDPFNEHDFFKQDMATREKKKRDKGCPAAFDGLRPSRPTPSHPLVVTPGDERDGYLDDMTSMLKCEDYCGEKPDDEKEHETCRERFGDAKSQRDAGNKAFVCYDPLRNGGGCWTRDPTNGNDFKAI